MQYLLCKCEEPELILFSLNQLNYDFKNILTGYTKILSGKPYFICINVNEKYYYIYSESGICQHCLFDYVYLDNDAEILNKIGVTNSINEQRKLLQKFLDTHRHTDLEKLAKSKNSFDNLPDFFKTALENINNPKSDDVDEKFEKAIQPGRIIELDINDQRYLGIILTSKSIMYTNSKGEIKGYINNFTMNNPYKIKRILIPTDKYFQLKDYSLMPIAWQRPIEQAVVKKTVAEIEKELGLAPGTLVIY